MCLIYNIDPFGYTYHNGVKVPNILCHADSHTLGLGCDHGDIKHWFPKYGKNMDTVRNDVAELLKSAIPDEEEEEIPQPEAQPEQEIPADEIPQPEDTAEENVPAPDNEFIVLNPETAMVVSPPIPQHTIQPV